MIKHYIHKKKTTMKRLKAHYLMLAMAVSTALAACEAENIVEQTSAISTETYFAPTFAEPDKSKQLNGSPAENLKALFEATGPEIITSLGRINITELDTQLHLQIHRQHQLFKASVALHHHSS
jgi:hypothetical protein